MSGTSDRHVQLIAQIHHLTEELRQAVRHRTFYWIARYSSELALVLAQAVVVLLVADRERHRGTDPGGVAPLGPVVIGPDDIPK